MQDGRIDKWRHDVFRSFCSQRRLLWIGFLITMYYFQINISGFVSFSKTIFHIRSTWLFRSTWSFRSIWPQNQEEEEDTSPMLDWCRGLMSARPIQIEDMVNHGGTSMVQHNEEIYQHDHWFLCVRPFIFCSICQSDLLGKRKMACLLLGSSRWQKKPFKMCPFHSMHLSHKRPVTKIGFSSRLLLSLCPVPMIGNCSLLTMSSQ
jgi:hypothetical protein